METATFMDGVLPFPTRRSRPALRPRAGGCPRGPARKPTRDLEPAAGARLQPQAAAVRLQYLPAEGETETGAGWLRGIEGKQRARHDLLVHAPAPVHHAENAALVGRAMDAERDLLRRAARLVGVLEQVDQHLLHLGSVEPAGLRGRSPLPPERAHAPHLFQELAPRHLPGVGTRQPGEARVSLEKLGEVRGPVFQYLEDALEAVGVLGPPEHVTRGVDEGADRGERVVQLVVHHGIAFFQTST